MSKARRQTPQRPVMFARLTRRLFALSFRLNQSVASLMPVLGTFEG